MLSVIVLSVVMLNDEPPIALPANIELDWKFFPGKNILAYYEPS
jgi:hypothetical protein